MELTVKFVDYGNEISVSKVDPRCGRSVASEVWSQRDQQRKSFSLILLTFYFKASSRRSMFVVRWPVASKRSNSFVRCLSLFSFMGVTLSVSITLMAASCDAVTGKLKQRLCIRHVPYATTRSNWAQPRMQNS